MGSHAEYTSFQEYKTQTNKGGCTLLPVLVHVEVEDGYAEASFIRSQWILRAAHFSTKAIFPPFQAD